MQLLDVVLCSVTLIVIYRNRYMLLCRSINMFNWFRGSNVLDYKFIKFNEKTDIYEYRVRFLQDTLHVKIIGKEIKNTTELEKKLQMLNIVLYCIIKNDENDEIIDLTDKLREFFYNYDTDLFFGIFLDTVKFTNEKSKLIIYINNNEMKDYEYNLKDVHNKTFRELFIDCQ